MQKSTSDRGDVDTSAAKALSCVLKWVCSHFQVPLVIVVQSKCFKWTQISWAVHAGYLM